MLVWVFALSLLVWFVCVLILWCMSVLIVVELTRNFNGLLLLKIGFLLVFI